MINRMLGAALLRVGTFEDVEHDRSATSQAMLVVIIVAISSGVGGVLSGDVGWVNGVIFGAVRGLIGWGRVGAGDLADRRNDTEDPGDPCRMGAVSTGHGVRADPGNSDHIRLHPGDRRNHRTASVRVAIRSHDDRCPASPGLHVDLAGFLRDPDLLHRGADRSDSRVYSVGRDG